MKKQLVLFALTALAFGLFAQQLPHYSQYLLNDYAINPAVGGSRNYFDAKLNNRNQWIGITDAPRTFVLSLHGPLNNPKMGVGGLVYADVTGPTRRTGITASYAYHLKLNETLKLSFGLSAGMIQYATDFSKITFNENNDPATSVNIAVKANNPVATRRYVM